VVLACQRQRRRCALAGCEQGQRLAGGWAGEGSWAAAYGRRTRGLHCEDGPGRAGTERLQGKRRRGTAGLWLLGSKQNGPERVEGRR
jgi:hypothetical protein